MNSEGVTTTGVIGVISDTHGLLRRDVCRIFNGVDMIVHAGDVGSMDVLNSLETIAPVTAVYGNMDGGIIAAFLNESEIFEFCGFKFQLLHDLSRLTIDPAAFGIHGVIAGHSHFPEVKTENDILYLNPGSAGPGRPNKPVSLAKITVRDGRLWVKHFDLGGSIT